MMTIGDTDEGSIIFSSRRKKGYDLLHLPQHCIASFPNDTQHQFGDQGYLNYPQDAYKNFQDHIDLRCNASYKYQQCNIIMHPDGENNHKTHKTFEEFTRNQSISTNAFNVRNHGVSTLPSNISRDPRKKTEIEKENISENRQPLDSTSHSSSQFPDGSRYSSLAIENEADPVRKKSASLGHKLAVKECSTNPSWESEHCRILSFDNRFTRLRLKEESLNRTKSGFINFFDLNNMSKDLWQKEIVPTKYRNIIPDGCDDISDEEQQSSARFHFETDRNSHTHASHVTNAALERISYKEWQSLSKAHQFCDNENFESSMGEVSKQLKNSEVLLERTKSKDLVVSSYDLQRKPHLLEECEFLSNDFIIQPNTASSHETNEFNTVDRRYKERCRRFLSRESCLKGSACKFIHRLPKDDNVYCKYALEGYCNNGALLCRYKHLVETPSHSVDENPSLAASPVSHASTQKKAFDAQKSQVKDYQFYKNEKCSSSNAKNLQSIMEDISSPCMEEISSPSSEEISLPRWEEVASCSLETIPEKTVRLSDLSKSSKKSKAEDVSVSRLDGPKDCTTIDVRYKERCRRFLKSRSCPKASNCKYLHAMPKDDNVYCKKALGGECDWDPVACWYKHPITTPSFTVANDNPCPNVSSISLVLKEKVDLHTQQSLSKDHQICNNENLTSSQQKISVGMIKETEQLRDSEVFIENPKSNVSSILSQDALKKSYLQEDCNFSHKLPTDMSKKPNAVDSCTMTEHVTVDKRIKERCRRFLLSLSCSKGSDCNYLHALPKDDNVYCKKALEGKCERYPCWYKHIEKTPCSTVDDGYPVSKSDANTCSIQCSLKENSKSFNASLKGIGATTSSGQTKGISRSSNGNNSLVINSLGLSLKALRQEGPKTFMKENSCHMPSNRSTKLIKSRSTSKVDLPNVMNMIDEREHQLPSSQSKLSSNQSEAQPPCKSEKTIGNSESGLNQRDCSFSQKESMEGRVSPLPSLWEEVKSNELKEKRRNKKERNSLSGFANQNEEVIGGNSSTTNLKRKQGKATLMEEKEVCFRKSTVLLNVKSNEFLVDKKKKKRSLSGDQEEKQKRFSNKKKKSLPSCANEEETLGKPFINQNENDYMFANQEDEEGEKKSFMIQERKRHRLDGTDHDVITTSQEDLSLHTNSKKCKRSSIKEVKNDSVGKLSHPNERKKHNSPIDQIKDGISSKSFCIDLGKNKNKFSPTGEKRQRRSSSVEEKNQQGLKGGDQSTVLKQMENIDNSSINQKEEITTKASVMSEKKKTKASRNKTKWSLSRFVIVHKKEKNFPSHESNRKGRKKKKRSPNNAQEKKGYRTTCDNVESCDKPHSEKNYIENNKEEKENKCTEDSIHIPVAEDSIHIPVAEDSIHIPVAEDSIHIPVAEDSIHIPVAEDSIQLDRREISYEETQKSRDISIASVAPFQLDQDSLNTDKTVIKYENMGAGNIQGDKKEDVPIKELEQINGSRNALQNDGAAKGTDTKFLTYTSKIDETSGNIKVRITKANSDVLSLSEKSKSEVGKKTCLMSTLDNCVRPSDIKLKKEIDCAKSESKALQEIIVGTETESYQGNASVVDRRKIKKNVTKNRKGPYDIGDSSRVICTNKKKTGPQNSDKSSEGQIATSIFENDGIGLPKSSVTTKEQLLEMIIRISAIADSNVDYSNKTLDDIYPEFKKCFRLYTGLDLIESLESDKYVVLEANVRILIAVIFCGKKVEQIKKDLLQFWESEPNLKEYKRKCEIEAENTG